MQAVYFVNVRDLKKQLLDVMATVNRMTLRGKRQSQLPAVEELLSAVHGQLTMKRDVLLIGQSRGGSFKSRGVK